MASDPSPAGLRCAACPARAPGLCAPMHGSEALAALEAARRPAVALPPRGAVFRQGEACRDVFILVSGWVVLAQALPDGRRQVLRFLLPGAIFGLHPEEQASHAQGAEALTPAVVCPIPAERLAALRHAWPALDDRLLWCLERDAAFAAEQMTTLGQRPALARVAHLLLELLVRLGGRHPPAEGDPVPMPLTHRLIGDATGLTPEHVTRMLRRLRQDGVARMSGGRLTLLDAARLLALADPPAELLALWAAAA